MCVDCVKQPKAASLEGQRRQTGLSNILWALATLDVHPPSAWLRLVSIVAGSCSCGAQFPALGHIPRAVGLRAPAAGAASKAAQGTLAGQPAQDETLWHTGRSHNSHSSV
eukprot:scaffold214705_cov17-Tisochrysis_lutea.AAC.3